MKTTDTYRKRVEEILKRNTRPDEHTSMLLGSWEFSADEIASKIDDLLALIQDNPAISAIPFDSVDDLPQMDAIGRLKVRLCECKECENQLPLRELLASGQRVSIEQIEPASEKEGGI